jgi:hypothetical protein
MHNEQNMPRVDVILSSCKSYLGLIAASIDSLRLLDLLNSAHRPLACLSLASGINQVLGTIAKLSNFC